MDVYKVFHENCERWDRQVAAIMCVAAAIVWAAKHMRRD